MKTHRNIPIPSVCPFCKDKVTYKRDKLLNYVYICTNCHASIGVYKNTKNPYGTLADKELKNLRKEARKSIDTIWQKGYLERNTAYKKLQKTLQIPDLYISILNKETCKCIISESQKLLRKYNHSQPCLNEWLKIK